MKWILGSHQETFRGPSLNRSHTTNRRAIHSCFRIFVCRVGCSYATKMQSKNFQFMRKSAVWGTFSNRSYFCTYLSQKSILYEMNIARNLRGPSLSAEGRNRSHTTKWRAILSGPLFVCHKNAKISKARNHRELTTLGLQFNALPVGHFVCPHHGECHQTFDTNNSTYSKHRAIFFRIESICMSKLNQQTKKRFQCWK